MKSKMLFMVLLIGATILFQSCTKKSLGTSRSELQVAPIEKILEGKDQDLINLLNKVRGSVGRRGTGSKTIWSRKNDYGIGLYISANHVYGVSGWTSRQAQIFDLSTENPGIFETSQIPPANGSIALGKTWIADFPLLHFDISAAATNSSILPNEDFYLGVIDNQRIEQGPFPKYPETVQKNIPLNMYDPENRTNANHTWNNAVEGQKAIAVGYPQDRANYPNGAVAFGKILSDPEVATIMNQLKTAGDSEGDIPYNVSAEFFVEAKGLPGMSGGAVFNAEGQLLGIMVRGSDKEQSPKIIRVVRMSYIKLKLNELYNGLSEPAMSKIRPFISGEL